MYRRNPLCEAYVQSTKENSPALHCVFKRISEHYIIYLAQWCAFDGASNTSCIISAKCI